jgi:hypothetical protein
MSRLCEELIKPKQKGTVEQRLTELEKSREYIMTELGTITKEIQKLRSEEKY